MRALSPALAAHLASGTTTLCWCWRLTRADGQKLGFTDHDRDITFDGTTFEAAAGFTASEIKDSVGLSVDDLEVESALSSDRLDEAGLAAGHFDDARVEIYRTNWSDPDQRVLLRSGSIGEVRRSGSIFTAEVRGLAHYLQQPQGRLYQYTCDAALGDTRCGVDVTTPTFRAAITIASVASAAQFTAANLDDYADAWFSRGVCQITSGAAIGERAEIRQHTVRNGVHTLELWHPFSIAPTTGDNATLTAGCDKTFTTCTQQFGNAKNFRGFPHMPGNDFVSTIARPGDPANTGASRQL